MPYIYFMDQKDFATNYLTSLEKEIRKLCPQSEILFFLLYEMKKMIKNPDFETDKTSFLELIYKFEDALDVEVFWS